MNLTMPVPHEGRERYLREQRDEARAERDALAAKVERVRALAHQADRTANLDWRGIVTTDDLRAALYTPEGEQ